MLCTRIPQKSSFLQSASKIHPEIILLLLAWKKGQTFYFIEDSCVFGRECLYLDHSSQVKG